MGFKEIDSPPTSSSKSERKSKGTQNISGNEVENSTLRRGSQCSTGICPFLSSDVVAVFGFGQVHSRSDFRTVLLSARDVAGSHTRLAGEDHLDPVLGACDIANVLFFLSASLFGVVGVPKDFGLAYME